MQTVFWTDIKKHHIEKKLEKLFPLFVKSLIDDEIFEVINSDIDLSKKQKIYYELTDICNNFIFGDKNLYYQKLISREYKIINSNKSIIDFLRGKINNG